MIRVLHNGVCWFLSAVLLLTNGWPVAIHHAHDVGENPYHHSHRAGALDVARHAPPSIGDPDGEVSGVTEHVHMLWLGWEVTVVPPKGSKTSPPAVAVLSQQADRGPAECDAALAWSETSLALVAVDPVNHDCRSPALADSRHRVAALPLCETARHLRSGVQLI
ncbi:MAG TPA: hypothetical protein VG826_18550 [Pirellulales bacterium]|nr:hypothetical protein [Pirellulales bacterium]